MLRDSLSNQLRVKETKGGFISFLNPRAYFGVTYPLRDHLNAGALVRTELYPGRPIVGTTVSLNTYGWKGFSGSLSYSAMFLSAMIQLFSCLKNLILISLGVAMLE